MSGKLFGRRVYEVLTVDLVEMLARHIQSGAPCGEETIVLEVGAGNGALGHHLREALRRLQEEEGSSGKGASGTRFKVEWRACHAEVPACCS